MADLQLTRWKLGEAKFFLLHMEDRTQQMTQHDHEKTVFEYYLSAFLNAAYSVKEIFFVEGQKLYPGQKLSDVMERWKQTLKTEDAELWNSMPEHRRKVVTRKDDPMSTTTPVSFRSRGLGTSIPLLF
jgi:hypothetical protein